MDETNGVIRVALSGRITYADHASFKTVMAAVGRSQASRLEFNLAEAEFIDSAGLGMLLLAREAAAQRQTAMVLKHPKGQVQEIILSNKFETLFSIQP